MSERATIYVVDDDPSFRAAISRVLKAASYDVVVPESAAEFIEMSPGSRRGCILLDLRMPGLDGLQAQNRLVGRGNRLPIIFLSGHGDVETSVVAVKAGAEDFLLKPVKPAKLLQTIERALKRCDEIQERDSRLDTLRARVATLSPREREVFDLIVRGKLHKHIAHQMGTAVRTVKAHRRNVMLKLQIESLAEAVSIAERLGLMAEPGDADVKHVK